MYKMSLQELLTKIIAFDTTSRNSNRACIDFIRDYLDQFGIRSEIITNDTGDKACLWATIGESDHPGVVLAGHSDVVPVDGQNWTTNPFVLTERDENFVARGSCDMKGFIACAIKTSIEVSKTQLAQPIHLAFTYDEECSMEGASRLTEYLRQRHVKPEWVWVGEPTGLHIIDSHKGVAAFETNILGIPGHSGQPDKGLNAIDVATDFMEILREVYKKRRATPSSPSRFDPPFTTLNLGIIEGGTAENIIAERCKILWQVRAHPGDTAVAFLSEVQNASQDKILPRLEAFTPRAGIKTCTCFDIPPLLPSINNLAHNALAPLTGDQETKAVSFATEGGFYQSLGTHVAICGPGSIDNAHQPDEFVPRLELDRCCEMIMQIACGMGSAHILSAKKS